jgi:sugar/nucleoside kinase (ribokinase family)
MTTVDYVVVANIIGDDLLLSDGERRFDILGGAGTYAAAGIRIWSDRVGIVSGIGEDFEGIYGSWFDLNKIDKSGLHVRALHTPRSWIDYKSADERTETPRYGPEHFELMEPTVEDIPAEFHCPRGLYLFRDTDTTYWNQVFQFQGKHHPTIIWEIHAGAANAHHWERVAAILSRIDLFSLNLSEASQLCELTNPAQIIHKLLATGINGVALRVGSEGTIVADQHGIWRIPAFQLEVVDVTGAGNAFTGGFLVGYCISNSDIKVAGQYGAASASFMLQQFGPPLEIGQATRQIAEARAQSLIPIRMG